MITGGKVGQVLGRRRAFTIGCLVYGAGSLTTALSPNLAVLLVGWSLLEGLSAALPAVVALVASNFDRKVPPRAYGLVAPAAAGRRLSSGAIASLVGLAALIIFILQNTDPVEFRFRFTWPVWLYTIITALLGALVWFGLGVIRRHRRRVRSRQYR